MNIQRIKFNEYSKEVLEQMPKGIFLTVKDGDNTNTMTIGWGSLGIMWGKPVFMAMVRYSRHTYELLEKSKQFTVSIPIKNDVKKKLAYCGTYSGRDVDKFREANISTMVGQKIPVPIISDCELHYECRVVYQQTMEPGTLDENIRNKHYSNNDYHVLYYGEIIDTYVVSK